MLIAVCDPHERPADVGFSAPTLLAGRLLLVLARGRASVGGLAHRCRAGRGVMSTGNAPPLPPRPTLAVPCLAGRAVELVDSSALRFLTASAVEAKRKEEEEEVLAQKRHEPHSLLAVPRERRTPGPAQQGPGAFWRGGSRSSLLPPREREEEAEEKKRVPKSSSLFSRFCQRHSHIERWIFVFCGPLGTGSPVLCLGVCGGSTADTCVHASVLVVFGLFLDFCT